MRTAPRSAAGPPRWRADISVAWWLKMRDVRSLAGRRWVFTLLSSCYLAFSLLLIAGAGVVHHRDPLTLPLASLLVPLWLLWALLPAIGGGGGDVEAAASLAPYPVSARVHLASGWISAALDLQYLLPVPGFTAALVAGYGWVAVLPAAAFTAGASALGQLVSWASVGGLRPSRGQTLTGTAALTCVLAVGYLVSGSAAGTTLALLPTGWLMSASSSAAAGTGVGWLTCAGLCIALAAPAAVLLAAGPRLVSRAQLARAAGPRQTSRAAASRPLPANTFAALFASAWRGVTRSLAFKAVLLTGLAVPFVAGSAYPRLDTLSLASLTLAAGGASVAANAWSYDAGGTVLLLAAPVSRARLVMVRAAVVASVLVLLVTLVEAAGLLVGLPGTVGKTAAFCLVLVALVTASGLRVASKHPAPADLDSLRGRPTAFRAAMLYTLRVGVGCVVVSSLWSVPVWGAPASAVAVTAYCLWCAWATRRALRDGARLLSAFAGIR